MSLRSSRALLGTVAVVLGSAACSQPSTVPTAPSGPSGAIAFLLGGTTTDPTPELGFVKVCKEAPDATFPGTFTLSSAGVNGGSATLTSSPTTIFVDDCKYVAESSSAAPAGANITITETVGNVISISAQRNLNGSVSAISFANGGSVLLNATTGYTIVYANGPDAPGPGTGTNGCTPGYWKQPHHSDSWPAAYAPTASFNTVFGIGTAWFSNTFTLVDALGANGGKEKALARHATAALLNAASQFYPLTAAEVIDRVQDVYAGALAMEAAKDDLALKNDAGCTLN